ncbi:MAG: CehA/McbA family metallohydrolase [bacterium]|nr:CehA/McbA family metallohydrolase [bacterium]
MRKRHSRTHADPLMPDAGKADLHMHTTASDGNASPKRLLDHVEQRTDLDVIAITDHDTMDGALEAKRIHEAGDYRFDLILGQEVTSTAGHILGLFIEKPVPKERSAEETIRLIHKQGGLAIAAHPMLVMRYTDPDMLTADGVGADVLLGEQFDGVEIVNGSPTLGNENARARLLNRTILFRAETGGSDAHILDAIGKGYTLFPGRTAADLRRAVEQKTTEAVSTKYRIRELLRYGRFFMKMKFRETGKRMFALFGQGRRKERARASASADPALRAPRKKAAR